MLFETTRTIGTPAVYRKTILAGALSEYDQGEKRAQTVPGREQIGKIALHGLSATVAVFSRSPLFFLSDTHLVSEQVQHQSHRAKRVYEY